MVRCNILVAVLFLVLGANAQVTNEGSPKSFGLQNIESIAPVIMKSFDLNKIKAEDAVNDTKRGVPYRFGYELKANVGLKNAGKWIDLPNKDRIWRINIVSKGAKTINVIFDTYKVPRGGTIYLYNNDKSDVLGAYTNIFNRPDEMLGTWLVEGDNIWVEYYEPASVRGKGELNIAKIIHGYRSITDAMIRQKKPLGSSGDCNQDVDCPVGADFDPLKDGLKKSVAFIIMQGFVCTGTLINNTNNDKAPYFLTANHCNAGSESTWAFRFNWISQNPSCSTTESSTDAAVNQTTSGATLRASNSKSDFRLLNLDGGLDESWDLEWAGWDRSGEAPNFVVGIHHPLGDIMKVCRENNPLSKLAGVEIRGLLGPVDAWRISDWDLGVTEGGSSGSALFDQNGRIIGQLAGGRAACLDLDDNGSPDFYGRFELSWDFGTTDDTRLSNWLDPTNTGRLTLDSYTQEINGGITPPVEEEEITVTFIISDAMVVITNGAAKVLDYIIYDMSGQQISSGQLAEEEHEIDMTNRSSGMYFVYITNTSDGTSFTKKVLINKGL